MEITNLHITDGHANLGDMSCAPLLYFDFPGYEKRIADVRHWNDTWDTPIILGGGGILIHPFDYIYESKIPKMKKPIIFWGGGANTPTLENYPEWLSKASLVGVRDYGTSYPWVPCVSCMSPLFDDIPEPTQEMVVYDHWQFPVPIEGFQRMKNDCTDFERVIRFIASGETVFTSSYHGVYWGTLLKRKVLVSPFVSQSSRWLRMKYKPTFVRDGDEWKLSIRLARTYPEALTECREENHKFYSRVRDLISH